MTNAVHKKIGPTVAENAGVGPEFFRLPKSGSRDPIFGLSRSGWNNLILPCEANGFKPPIKSVSLRQRGAIRGVRLILADSAREYFNRLVAESNVFNGDRRVEKVNDTFRSRECGSSKKPLIIPDKLER
jgi:hypothetical protein